MGSKRDLLTVSVGRGVNDLEAGQNDVPVRIEEDGARLRDQRRRDAPALTGAAFRQAFNPLQRRQIRSPKPSLQNEVSHRRHGVLAEHHPRPLGSRCPKRHPWRWPRRPSRFPAARRVREDGGESGREGMPSFSAARIDSSSRAPRAVVFEGGAARFGSDVQTRNRDVAGAPRRRRRLSSRAVPSGQTAFLQGISWTRPCRELVSGACLVEVGKGNGQSPRKSG